MSAHDSQREHVERSYALFSASLDLPATERWRFLEEACGADGPVRRQVDRLLAAAEKAARADEQRLADRFPHLFAALGEELDGSPHGDLGLRVGPYRLIELLGRGGMGVVWLAERVDGAFEKRVALKMVPAWESPEDLPRRLRSERQILAGLEHPNIARLLDGGKTDEGVPYLVMEHVDGEAIDTYCARRGFGVGERIRLLLAVCDAVAAAHRRLVVHRDLKPSNVLVTAGGRVKLLDFGIAKLLAEGDEQGATRTGMLPLTPQYAAPEQLAGGAITTATDVYGLGALLYQLLTGQPPHPLTGLGAAEALRPVLECEPPPPSRVAAKDRRRRLAGDLDAIVMRALRREPVGRYPSVEALAEDLRRFLDGRPVTARPPSLSYRARKLLRRRPGAVAAVVLVVALAAVVIGALVHQAEVAQREQRRAEEVTAFFTGVLRQADPDEAMGGEITLRQLLDHSMEQLAARLHDQPKLRADVLDVLGEAYLDLDLQEPSVAAFEEALALRRQLRGNSHPETLDSLMRRIVAGRRRCSAEDVPGLEALLDEAQELAAALHGNRSVEAAGVAHERGWVHSACFVRNDPRHRMGERWLREAEAILRELGGDSPELANVLHDLRGYVSPDEGERLTREALAMRRRLFGDRDLRVARSLNDLGLHLEGKGRSEEGLPLVEQALELHRELLGERHPQTIGVTNNVAAILRDQGRFAEAEPLYRQVLAVRSSRLPPDHIALSYSHYGLGRVLMGQGELEAAEGHLRAAFEILDAHGGALAGVAASVLGECLAGQGRAEEARSLLETGHRIAAAALGDDHGETMAAAQRLRRLGAGSP